MRSIQSQTRLPLAYRLGALVLTLAPAALLILLLAATPAASGGAPVGKAEPAGAIPAMAARALAAFAGIPPAGTGFEVQPIPASGVSETNSLPGDGLYGYSLAMQDDLLIVADLDADTPAAALAGAVHLYRRNEGGPDNWGEIALVYAGDGESGDLFGWSVAIDGNLLLVGAIGEDGGITNALTDAGAGYIFTLGANGAWTETVKLSASTPQAGAQFGWSAAIDLSTAVVGTGYAAGAQTPVAAGTADVFEQDQGGSNNWGHAKKLTADIPATGDLFGHVLGISQDTIVVGAPFEDHVSPTLIVDAGAAYIFGRDQGGAANWGQVQRLMPANPHVDNHFGYAVVMSPTLIAVGAPGEHHDGPFCTTCPDGGVYLYNPSTTQPGSWEGQDWLLPFDSSIYMGAYLALDDDILLVRAGGEVMVYKQGVIGPSQWSAIGRLWPSSCGFNCNFAQSLAVSDSVFAANKLDDNISLNKVLLYENIDFPPVPYPGPSYDWYDYYSVNEGDFLTLDGSLSYDDFDAAADLYYEWDFVYSYDDEIFTFDAAGITPTYSAANSDGPSSGWVALRVTDSSSQTSVVWTTIVAVMNVSPTVQAGNDLTATVDDPLTFAGAFTDPGISDTHTITWTFGDGATALGTLTPTHTFTGTGTFTVTLTVTDDDGGVGVDTLLVTVVEAEFFGYLPVVLKP